jgi:hypothetical protein
MATVKFFYTLPWNWKLVDYPRAKTVSWYLFAGSAYSGVFACQTYAASLVSAFLRNWYYFCPLIIRYESGGGRCEKDFHESVQAQDGNGRAFVRFTGIGRVRLYAQ